MGRASLETLCARLVADDAVFRSADASGRRHAGTAEDYANLIAAAAAVAMSDLGSDAVSLAERLTTGIEARLSAESGGFVQAASGDVIVRSRTIYDNAVPPANATMLANYARHDALFGRAEARRRAQEIVRLFAGVALRAPGGTASFLNALEQFLSPLTVTLVVPKSEPADDLTKFGDLGRAAFACPDPNCRIAWIFEGASLPESHPAHGKAAIGGKPTAYVCRGQVCSRPVTNPLELAELLRRPSVNA